MIARSFLIPLLGRDIETYLKQVLFNFVLVAKSISITGRCQDSGGTDQYSFFSQNGIEWYAEILRGPNYSFEQRFTQSNFFVNNKNH